MRAPLVIFRRSEVGDSRISYNLLDLWALSNLAGGGAGGTRVDRFSGEAPGDVRKPVSAAAVSTGTFEVSSRYPRGQPFSW
jgi:hypothetical protein